jgi:hypothetical protein
MVTVKEFVRIRIIEDGKAISEISSGDDLWVNYHADVGIRETDETRVVLVPN